MASEVIVYSMEGCPPCRMVKDLLTRMGVEYTVKDVTRDPQARQEFLSRGFRGTPVTVIDGEAIVGFDQARIAAALQGRRVRTQAPTGKPPVQIVW